ncbi:MAG: Na(+)/H(+) antiporter subunit D [Deltaproteobacteria bacterium]|nr:Na(+)/H(+) antiporter subunit D [Deltaproteobacteria bacterium]
MSWVHPGAILIFGSLLALFMKGRVRQVYLLILPVAALISLLTLKTGQYGVFHLLHEEIIFGRVDKLSLVFAYVFTIAAFIGMLYASNVKEVGHHIASYVYAGSAIGTVFAGDFISLFIFWEAMAFSSVFLILAGRTEESYGAAYRYILIHVIGGMLLMGGMKLVFHETGSIEFTQITLGSLGSWMMLIGILVNAAAWPLNAWLPDSYPRASVAGAVFLCAFTTKSAVYALIRGFSGAEILVPIGVIMVLYGIIYAMMENDIRRVMAYSIVSQVGYMVVGVGIGTEMAINGVSAQAVAHILYKGLLFMATGSVLFMAGTAKMTELGGLYSRMPKTFWLYMVGALSIAALPLTSGFVAKPVILGAVSGAGHETTWVLLTIASFGTMLYAALKVPYLVFIGETTNRTYNDTVTDPPSHMTVAMIIAAVLCVLIGIFPGALYNLLPFAMEYHPYGAEHVVLALEGLAFTAVAFVIARKAIRACPLITIDTDWFYRVLGRAFLWFANRVLAVIDDAVSNSYKTIVEAWGFFIARASLCFDVAIVDGIVNGVAKGVVGMSTALRTFQTGIVQHYAAGILIGLLVLLNLYFIIS